MKRTTPTHAAIAADLAFYRPAEPDEAKPVTTDLGVAYYRGVGGRAVFVNPSAAALPVSGQAKLLREAARAMAAEAERLQQRG